MTMDIISRCALGQNISCIKVRHCKFCLAISFFPCARSYFPAQSLFFSALEHSRSRVNYRINQDLSGPR